MYLDDFQSNIKPDSTSYKVFYAKWKNTLFEYCMKLFTWSGLPDSIPQKEIETRLFLYGKCGINKCSHTGKLIAAHISFTGPTDYFDEFEKYTYTTPRESGQRYIGTNGVVIDNNPLRNPFYNTIHCYAAQLAHADVTFICNNVNGRSSQAVTAINERYKNVANDYINAQYNGRPQSLVDKGFNTIEIRDTFTRNTINNREIIDTRQLILSEFLELLGIKKMREKRERMVSNEVESNGDLLKLNIKGMLDSRQQGADEVNRIFGTDITVEANVELEEPETEPAEQHPKEVENNDGT